MENLSHSRQPNKPSKKMYGSVGFVPKYDDVFGGPPKFGVQTLSPRVEDYSEIFSSFHASRASSIPVLDLPVVEEAEVSFDVRSSSFDYAEVFGGFDGLDFAVSYEELVFGESKGEDEFYSEEAWNPAVTGSLSEELDHSGKNQCLPHGDSYHLFDERTEFSISYHKATRSSEDFSNLMTHTTQLHDVPGFTCDIDQITPLQKTEDENPFLQMIDDSNLDMDFSAEAMKGKHLRKTMSHPPKGSAGGQVENDVKSQSGYNKNGYYPNETFISISEISLRTHPSQLPPPSRPPPKKGDSSGLSSNCNANASEGTAGDISPPFFDVEVDATSPAAISAAAMKEAMAKAQAKLKSVKELMERKEGFQRRMRPGSRSGKKDKEEKLSEIVDGTDSLKNEGLLAVSDSLEGEKLLNAKKFADEKRGKESRSPQQFVEIGRADEWKEATQFFELVRTDKSRKDFEQANNENFLVQNTKSHEREQKEKKATMEAFNEQEDYEKNLKAVAEDHEQEAYEKKVKVIKDNCEREKNSGKLKASKGTRKQKEHEKKVKVAQEACEREGNENKFKMVQQPVEIEKKLTGADESVKHEKLVELQVEESQIEFEQAIKCKENGPKVKEANRRIKSEKKLKESRQREEDNGNKQKQVFEREDEKKPKEILELAEGEKILKKSLEQEDREQKSREVFEGDENEKKRNEARKREENEKTLKEALEKAENEKRLKEALEQEKNEKKRKEAREREKTEKGLKEAHEREGKEKKTKKGLEEEYIEKSLKEVCKVEDNSNIVKQVQEKDERELRLKEARQREVENASKQASKWAEEEKPLKYAGEREELAGVKAGDQRLKFAQGASMHVEVEVEVEDVGTSSEACKVDDSKNFQATQLACEREENSGKVEATEEALAHDDGMMGNGGKESKAVEIADVLVEERSEASGIAQGDLEDEDNKCRMEDATESILSHDSMKKVGVAGIGIGQTHVEQRKTTSRKDSDPKNRDKKCSHEWGDCDENITQAEVAQNLEENKDKFASAQVAKEWVENGRKTEAAQPAVLEGKRNAQKTAPQVNTNQSLDRKEENLNEILTSEVKEIERMKRERELEKERLRKIEEEREREREREKDRMAIDRATLEAREISYTELRERAERAAMERAISEARQRAMTEARERLERACAEAREKSLIDKAIMEAKLRAERAAVERATAEARERAVEKAMAEKAAAEARERVERSRVRQSSSSSDQQVLQPHSAGPSSGARYPYSSVYGGATSNMERSEGVEGESPQRCKARLERHQRTAERAAKALAEKNMRDLHVQREQAERNRSAETLDADVRRWSSGKEGNLRALLSTLQYILGPDSGWQPVPLTEVITAAAVKKAYRKATLCVHPDKLQQRGASIQQKYICEKVFDLLKDAWNRFNSEER